MLHIGHSQRRQGSKEEDSTAQQSPQNHPYNWQIKSLLYMPLLGSCVSSSPSRLSSHKQGLEHPTVMASLTSLPHLPPFVSHSSSSSSSSITRLSPSKIQRVTIMSPRRPLSGKRSVAPISAVDEVSVVDPPPPPPFSEDKSEIIASLKLKLLVIRSTAD
jgi:hypothetical protein